MLRLNRTLFNFYSFLPSLFLLLRPGADAHTHTLHYTLPPLVLGSLSLIGHDCMTLSSVKHTSRTPPQRVPHPAHFLPPECFLHSKSTSFASTVPLTFIHQIVSSTPNPPTSRPPSLPLPPVPGLSPLSEHDR